MAWYRFKFRHGPGHQGNTEVYEWYDSDLSVEEERDEMHEHAHARYIEDWYCDCDKVEALPEEVRAEKIARYTSMKRGAEAMLRLLGVG